MKPLTAITTYNCEPHFEKALLSLIESGLVEEILIVCPEMMGIKIPQCRILTGATLQSQKVLSQVIDEAKTRYLLFLPGAKQSTIEPEALEKLIKIAEPKKAGIVFSDFYDEGGQGRALHPLNDYQLGSVRDDFNFGGLMIFSTEAVRAVLQKYGHIPDVSYAGLYDLRLKVSIDYPIHHLPEPLYSLAQSVESSGDTRLFAYVDPRNTGVQKEMEIVFTDYLKKIGAYLPPDALKQAEQSRESFPVEASVVIPVRNRHGTIRDAVESALSQEADFPFNVIVVDNHSMDGTSDILFDLASKHPSLKHIIPERTDLGIGGCWNEAINSKFCGQYAVQLDSDDLYSSPGAVRRIVDTLRDGKYAMVIGSYTIVNSKLEKIPPGLIDHQEWSDENGHNNALRINGLGAPRAFDTNIIRSIGFLNVSYGEDYAAALRACRQYRIGRIYDSLYLARRWEGNTDAALTIEETNRNNVFKDRIRTKEILARQKINTGVNT
ncbi:MAG: glycosyltransferase [Deltaproteobacteria bacterium]|nr:glycosyltransferase [Deltaproteobacteria bacterium]